MSRPLSPGRVRLLASAALILAFVAGALAGTAWERMHAPRDHRPGGPRGPHRFAEMMARRYDLSPDQAKRVEVILARRRPRVDSLMASVQPQLRAAYDSTNAEVRQVLTPKQRVKFDEDLARRRRDFERDRPRP